MTDLPDLTPEVSAEIARLCGGELNGDRWMFASQIVHADEWLRPVCDDEEAVQESILLRRLLHPETGIASYVGPATNWRGPYYTDAEGVTRTAWGEVVTDDEREDGLPHPDHVFEAKIRWRASDHGKIGPKFYGATPLAALVALAAAHVEARKEGGK